MEQPQASQEEIISCGNCHPPSYLLHNKILVVNGSDDEKWFPGNEPTYEYFIHPVESKLEYQFDLISLHADESKLDSIEHMAHSIPEFHSPVGNDLGLVSVDFSIKSTNHVMHANPSPPLANING